MGYRNCFIAYHPAATGAMATATVHNTIRWVIKSFTVNDERRQPDSTRRASVAAVIG